MRREVNRIANDERRSRGWNDSMHLFDVYLSSITESLLLLLLLLPSQCQRVLISLIKQ